MNGFNDPIKEQLDKDERLYWSGQPETGIKLGPHDALLIPFSLMWGGFALFWEFSVISSGAPFFFKLWGIPFVLFGLYLIIGRFFLDSKQRDNTFYGITNKRVIIIKGLFSQTVNSLQLGSLNEISVSAKSDGTGTISFGRQNPMYSMFSNLSWPGMGAHQVPSFRYIADVNKVNKIIKENHEKLKS